MSQNKITTSMQSLIEPLVKQEIAKIAGIVYKEMVDDFEKRLTERAKNDLKDLSVKISEQLGGMAVDIVITPNK